MSFKDKLPTVTRRQAIAITKGVIAYTVVFVLVFLHPFTDLIDYPITLTSMVVVSIAGTPGNSVGAAIDQFILGGSGVGLGGLFFLILAKLAPWPVPQAVVFWFMVYFLALIKAQGIRYFAFSLLAILVTFSGIYTPLVSANGGFEPRYLQSYLLAYAWAFALVLFINIFIFPVTSERELRELIVQSLERISTFTHLISKTYSLEISQEERAARDALGQSIRADFAFLKVKLAQTAYEVNWTRWSMADYARIVSRINSMQQGLITCNSSLNVMERFEPAGLALIKHQLDQTATGKSFNKLRRGFDLSVADIVEELAVGGQVYHSPAPEAYGSWDDFLELDDQEQEPAHDLESSRARQPSISHASPDLQRRLIAVSARLRDEIQHASQSPAVSRRPSFSDSHGEQEKDHQDKERDLSAAGDTTAVPSGQASQFEVRKTRVQMGDRSEFLRSCWTKFKTDQNASIVELLASGLVEDDELRVLAPSPSLHEQFSTRMVGKRPGTTTASGVKTNVTEATQRPIAAATVSSPVVEPHAPVGTDTSPPKLEMSEQICGTSVLRTMSFIFGMGQVVEEVTALHDDVVPRDPTVRRKKKLHLHFLERLPKPPKRTSAMSLRDALSKLTGRSYPETKVSLWARIGQVERLLRSNNSIYALKTAFAVLVFAVIALASATFFVQYGLTGGVLSLVVAISSSVGQTIFTFVLQILGTALGTLYGLLILRISLDVGDYTFNPYILVCLLALWAVPGCYIIYTRPMFFAGALLAMNGAGILVITEYIYNDTPGQIRPNFDSPAFRAGKSLASLAIALGIASVFVFIILRTPARHTLRENLSRITFSLANYSVLLGALVESFHPIDTDTTAVQTRSPPNAEAAAAVREELIRREGQIQGELLALMPLLKFSAAEPSYGLPFQASTMVALIRQHQIILDRLREARTAIGDDGFSDAIRDQIMAVLAPYRANARRYQRALFYLVSTSLATKSPLPHELPSLVSASRNIQHDALVLSSRLAKTPEGMRVLGSSSFRRYWFYVTAYSGVAGTLESMEANLRLLLGELEESPFVTRERDPKY